ncbi:MAG: hypothetical protein PHR35_18145 [Kiritimatiellae bacterium]|nr:hypothetical protein [Kiritimatiellia bacterium]
MSAWRRQALSLLPEYRAIIQAADNPMALWIELHLEFDRAMAHPESELVARFIRFAAWCISPAAGPLPNDTSTAVACAFYEHLPEKQSYWPYFRKWFSRSEFEGLLPVFSYHTSPQQLESLKKSFANAA